MLTLLMSVLSSEEEQLLYNLFTKDKMAGPKLFFIEFRCPTITCSYFIPYL